jgi:hypothetical protein
VKDLAVGLLSLTRYLVGVMILFLVGALLARNGLLDDTGRVLVALLMLPVKLVDLLIEVNRAGIGFFFGGAASAPPPTTVP